MQVLLYWLESGGGLMEGDGVVEWEMRFGGFGSDVMRAQR